jgi:hypothetical protein
MGVMTAIARRAQTLDLIAACDSCLLPSSGMRGNAWRVNGAKRVEHV